jgi:hypothetical protein
MYYAEKCPRFIKRGDEDGMRNLVYWFGKAAEMEEEQDAKKALALMALHLDEAMRVCHAQPIKCYDPLPGYSHIPFCNREVFPRD